MFLIISEIYLFYFKLTLNTFLFVDDMEMILNSMMS